MQQDTPSRQPLALLSKCVGDAQQSLRESLSLGADMSAVMGEGRDRIRWDRVEVKKNKRKYVRGEEKDGGEGDDREVNE